MTFRNSTLPILSVSVLAVVGLAACTSNGSSDAGGSNDTMSGLTNGLDEGQDVDADQGDASDMGDAGTDDDGGPKFDLPDDDGGTEPPPEPFHDHPNLWYSVGELLVYIRLDPADGSVVELVSHEIVNVTNLEVDSGGNGLTMLSDGSLIGFKLHTGANRTEIYRIAEPPEGSASQTITPEFLGVMPDSIMLEALYTGCEDRLYGMDTGDDVTSSDGNRLLEYVGDVPSGDLSYAVVSDLSTAQVADIDDMAPGIDDMGQIRDTPGLAIDSGTVHEFDYVVGTGTEVSMAGTYGIHTISGELFDDGEARVYVLDSEAQLYELDYETWTVTGPLVQGPANDVGPSARGNGGITGPAPSCVSSFPPVG